MIYLDTHVVIWLFLGTPELLSKQATQYIEKHDVLISPMVYLELELLYDIGRTKYPADQIIESLNQGLNLQICDTPFLNIIKSASKLKWIRDPFDRIIVAHAEINQSPLLTKDKIIHQQCKLAVW